jgi:hypothetical protein
MTPRAAAPSFIFIFIFTCIAKTDLDPFERVLPG